MPDTDPVHASDVATRGVITLYQCDDCNHVRPIHRTDYDVAHRGNLWPRSLPCPKCPGQQWPRQARRATAFEYLVFLRLVQHADRAPAKKYWNEELDEYPLDALSHPPEAEVRA